MVDFITRYEKHDANAEIAASASAFFFVSKADQDARAKHGSFNSLEIINDGDIVIILDLDGLSTRRRKLFGKSTIVIEARENLFFDTLKITNTDAVTAISAADLQIVGRILKPTLTPVIAVR